MTHTKVRCRLEDRTIPTILFVVGVIALASFSLMAFVTHGLYYAFMAISQLFILAGVYYPSLFGGNTSVWSIIQDGESVQFIRDGTTLYQGRLDEIKIADEDRGVINFSTSNGTGFTFPRRRDFHDTLSKIESI